MSATARQPTPATSANAKAAKPGKGGGRRLWFDLHSWVGLKLCLFMGFICLTGTLAVFAAEIDWLLHPQMRVTPTDQHASWGTLVAAAQRAHPDWVLEGLRAPHASHFAAKAQMRRPDGRRRFVWIDPYSGQVTGDTHWFSAHRLLRNTHRHLMIPTKYGVPLVAALSLPLLLSLLSSLYIYKRWWRGFFSWPRADRPRRLWGDVHRLLGVWSLWFVALIALTGGWYLIESLGGKAPPQRDIALPEPGPTAPADAAAIDRAVATLGAQWPALEIRGVEVSPDGGALVLDGQAQAWLVRDRANVAGIDLRDGRLLGRHEGGELGVHQRISEMADPLHFGSFGGWPVRLLWFLFGAALTALSFTGVYLYGLRVADALRSAQRRKPA
ncbi:PepSY-associated TM helix domain-containing protein [Xanthomonas sp. XNM01]|uniref:PepSY-associated TM helix domain-containing protein n=1 Tax=Xanthomonas sp. XNM01 TaxID=2769289 RepID=UPI001784F5BC|nr:PepSY-associated TM helix domain-containing protein [Xanthomonas sp. XNM01]MBD9369772.1 PepSY domain-containing protein [Xanthomonas sp. XNM01]